MTWMTKASEAMFLALCAVFGLDPDSTEANRRFRDTFTDDATYPQPDRNQDVTYYTLSEQSDPGANTVEQCVIDSGDGPVIRVRTTVPISCLFVFYGPSADDCAETMWSKLYVDWGYNSPRAILREKNIVPIPYHDRPTSAPELEGSLYRRRCDLRIRFNLLNVETIAVSTVQTPPELDIRH